MQEETHPFTVCDHHHTHSIIKYRTNSAVDAALCNKLTTNNG
jgi:hypothetical protein